MSEKTNGKILARVAAEDCIGRTRELEILRRYVEDEANTSGLLIPVAPLAGISELLKQTFDHLFNEQKSIPFYFAFSRRDKSAKDCAVSFLQEFLAQMVAFRRREADLLRVALNVCEIGELAAPPDAHWIHQLTKICDRKTELNDEKSFIRQALGAPLRAMANGAQTALLLDDLQNAPAGIIEELKKIYADSTVPFVFAGRRRFLLNKLQSGETGLKDAEILRIEDLPANDAELLADKLAKKFDVEISEPARDLIARQTNFKPALIEAICAAAGRLEKRLNGFQRVEQIYLDEICGGRISKFYDEVFSALPVATTVRKKIINLLREGIDSETKKIPATVWRAELSLNETDFETVLNCLHVEEFVNFSSGSIYFSSAPEVLKDYVTVRDELENRDAGRAQIIGEMLKIFLKRAPQLMADSYRQASALDLRRLLSVFNCQSVPANLINYAQFKKPHGETSGLLQVVLPQIVFAASGASFYPPIAQAADENRVAVALGFEAGDYRQENEIAWLAASIDSKLEAAKELTEFWCDRLEAMALICNFAKYQLWLIAPEGFAPDALEVLTQRNAFGSSRRQIELLSERLEAADVVPAKNHSSEYEMILPMGADTELIAANAVEEIARKHHFPAKDITKIKTALVEAYINAAEHSHSPDRKVYQKFTVDEDKITITIANRGIKLSAERFAESATPIEPDEGRRGWGLKLMRTLMDEVVFEQADDGTRISMVKYLNR